MKSKKIINGVVGVVAATVMTVGQVPVVAIADADNTGSTSETFTNASARAAIKAYKEDIVNKINALTGTDSATKSTYITDLEAYYKTQDERIEKGDLKNATDLEYRNFIASYETTVTNTYYVPVKLLSDKNETESYLKTYAASYTNMISAKTLTKLTDDNVKVYQKAISNCLDDAKKSIEAIKADDVITTPEAVEIEKAAQEKNIKAVYDKAVALNTERTNTENSIDTYSKDYSAEVNGLKNLKDKKTPVAEIETIAKDAKAGITGTAVTVSDSDLNEVKTIASDTKKSIQGVVVKAYQSDVSTAAAAVQKTINGYTLSTTEKDTYTSKIADYESAAETEVAKKAANKKADREKAITDKFTTPTDKILAEAKAISDVKADAKKTIETAATEVTNAVSGMAVSDDDKVVANEAINKAENSETVAVTKVIDATTTKAAVDVVKPACAEIESVITPAAVEFMDNKADTISDAIEAKTDLTLMIDADIEKYEDEVSNAAVAAVKNITAKDASRQTVLTALGVGRATVDNIYAEAKSYNKAKSDAQKTISDYAKSQKKYIESYTSQLSATDIVKVQNAIGGAVVTIKSSIASVSIFDAKTGVKTTANIDKAVADGKKAIGKIVDDSVKDKVDVDDVKKAAITSLDEAKKTADSAYSANKSSLDSKDKVDNKTQQKFYEDLIKNTYDTAKKSINNGTSQSGINSTCKEAVEKLNNVSKVLNAFGTNVGPAKSTLINRKNNALTKIENMKAHLGDDSTSAYKTQITAVADTFTTEVNSIREEVSEESVTVVVNGKSEKYTENMTKIAQEAADTALKNVQTKQKDELEKYAGKKTDYSDGKKKEIAALQYTKSTDKKPVYLSEANVAAYNKKIDDIVTAAEKEIDKAEMSKINVDNADDEVKAKEDSIKAIVSDAKAKIDAVVKEATELSDAKKARVEELSKAYQVPAVDYVNALNDKYITSSDVAESKINTAFGLVKAAIISADSLDAANSTDEVKNIESDIAKEVATVAKEYVNTYVVEVTNDVKGFETTTAAVGLSEKNRDAAVNNITKTATDAIKSSGTIDKAATTLANVTSAFETAITSMDKKAAETYRPVAKYHIDNKNVAIRAAIESYKYVSYLTTDDYDKYINNVIAEANSNIDATDNWTDIQKIEKATIKTLDTNAKTMESVAFTNVGNNAISRIQKQAESAKVVFAALTALGSDVATYNAKADAIVSEASVSIKAVTTKDTDPVNAIDKLSNKAVSDLDNLQKDAVIASAKAEVKAYADTALKTVSELKALAEADKNAATANITNVVSDSAVKVDSITKDVAVVSIKTSADAIVVDSKASIDKVVASATDANVKAEAAKSLAAAKETAAKDIDSYATAAKSEVNALTHISDTNKSDYAKQIDTAVASAKTAVTSATTVDAVTTAVANAKTSVDAVVTAAKATDDANKTADDKAKELAEAKTAAITELDTYVAEQKAIVNAFEYLTDASKAEYAARIDDAATAAKANANESGTTADVTAAVTVGKASINAVVTAATAVNDANKQIAEDEEVALENAKKAGATDIDTYVEEQKAAVEALEYLTADEKTEYAGQIDEAAATSKANVEAATEAAVVTTAVAEGKTAIDAVVTAATTANDAKKAEDEEAKKLAEAVSAGAAEIDTYVTEQKATLEALEYLTADEKTEYAGQIDEVAATAKANVEASTDVAVVTTAVAEGKTAIDVVVTAAIEANENNKPVNNIVKGDADLDGKLGLNDAKVALQAALGIVTLDEEALKNADIDGDGKVSLTDVGEILKAALGIIEL